MYIAAHYPAPAMCCRERVPRSKGVSTEPFPHRRSREAWSCRRTVFSTDEASIRMIWKAISGPCLDVQFYAALQKYVCVGATNHLTVAVNGSGLPTDGAMQTLPVPV